MKMTVRLCVQQKNCLFDLIVRKKVDVPFVEYAPSHYMYVKFTKRIMYGGDERNAI